MFDVICGDGKPLTLPESATDPERGRLLEAGVPAVRELFELPAA